MLTQKEQDNERINRFIYLVLPLVTAFVKTILESCGLQVEKQGQGLDTAFSISKDSKNTKMYLHNLLLEIATIDRDEKPLRFDERLQDFDFFMTKAARLIESKLRILFHLLGQEDMDKAIEKITQEAKHYQRIRILKIDQKKQDDKGK